MIPEAQKQQMAEAVAKIRETMAAAAKAAGRDPAEVRLCAACKTRTVEEVRYSADLPIDLFGENHVQELVEKDRRERLQRQARALHRAFTDEQGQQGRRPRRADPERGQHAPFG